MPKTAVPRTNDFREVAEWRRIISEGARQSSFSVHRNGVDQTISDSTFTKVEWTTELFDTNGDYDKDVTYAFVPSVAGKYLIVTKVRWAAATSGVKYLQVRKNGVQVALDSISGTTINMTLVFLDDANGSSDDFQTYVYQATGGDLDVNCNIGVSYFMGHRIPFS